MAASADATTLAASICSLVSQSHLAESRDERDLELPRLQREAACLRSSVDRFLTALPSEVGETVGSGRSDLRRHLYFIDYRLNLGQPRGCMKDPIDIAKLDIPGALGLFDDWHDRHSPGSERLAERLRPFISTGELNAALREVWAIFKSQMVDQFQVSDELDGHQLVDHLFGRNGATASVLSDRDRRAYANLLKGLYTLYRNPVVHNDTAVNPETTDAVFALINATLTSIDEFAGSQAGSESG